MPAYLVVVDVMSATPSHASLYSAVDAIDPRAERLMFQSWVVESDRSAKEIIGELAPFVGESGRCYVARLGGEVATLRLEDASAATLRRLSQRHDGE